MNDRYQEEHVCYQSQYGQLVLHRVCGECDRLARVRHAIRGTHHTVLLWSFGGDETTR